VAVAGLVVPLGDETGAAADVGIERGDVEITAGVKPMSAVRLSDERRTLTALPR
jgi:hypothetical protein